MYFTRQKIATARMTDQEDFIKTRVPKSHQTQCKVCGKWISKYWKISMFSNKAMNICAPCENRRNK